MRPFWHIGGYLQRPLVRPWALSGPVLVLMICLPMLRPLREPDSRKWSAHEQMMVATVQAIVEHHTLSLDQSVFKDNTVATRRDGHLYSPYSPMLALLLAPWYWLLMRNGLTYADDLIFVQYVLTIVGAAVPVAMCSGMVYRLARMFELRRSLRVGLGLAAVIGGGLISYGVVINQHAPAAMFVLMAVSMVSHLMITGHPYRNIILAFFSGLFATIAACIDPPAAVFAVLLPVVFLAMRWSGALRAGAMALYVIGAMVPIAANLALVSVGGELPAFADIGQPTAVMTRMNLSTTPAAVMAHPPTTEESDEDADTPPGPIKILWWRAAAWFGRCLEGLVGEHGILSHFPVMVVGLLGAIWVLHRNWTAATKAFAGATLAGCVLILVVFGFLGPRPMSFGAPWFVVMSPVLLMWGGAWLKRGHRSQSWTIVGIVLVFSMAAAFVGMTNPMPKRGYSGYSLGQATMRLIRSAPGAD